MPEIEELMQQPVEKVMVRRVVFIKIDQTLENMVTLLREKGISGLPVLDKEGKVCGVATEYDLVNFLSEKAKTRIKFPIELFALDRRERLNALKLLDEFKSTKVSEVMTSPAITASPSTSIRDVIALMVRNEVNRIPIAQDGKLVGIVTRADIVLALSEK
jgi:CBS domain-containing protein